MKGLEMSSGFNSDSIKSFGFIIRNVLKVFNYQQYNYYVEYGWIIDATFNKISESLIFFVSVHYCDNRICVLLDTSKMFIEGVGHTISCGFAKP